MEISGIRGSFGNLFQYINERDRDHSGVIENGEVSSEEFSRLDNDHDGQIQGLEIMQAANLASPARARHFSAGDLSQGRVANNNPIRLVNAETIYGVRFNRGSFILLGRGGSGVSILPSTNAIINDVANSVTFRAASVHFHTNGRVRMVELTANTSILNGIRFRAGTDVGFYENGHVLFGVLAADTTINGVSFSAGTGVYFYENGHVSHVNLAADTRISGRWFRYGTRVYFDENGRVTNP